MPDDNAAVASAKSALAKANKDFPSSMAVSAGVTPAGDRIKPNKVAKAAPPKSEGEDVAAGLQAIQDNIKQYQDATRSSDYRKVYLSRKGK